MAAPKWLCRTSRAAAVTGSGTSISRPSSSPRSRSLRKSSGVNVVVQSQLTKAGDLYRVNIEPMTPLLRKARKACRGTPILLVRSVISIRFSMTTPSITLCAILQTRANSPSPTYDTPCGAMTSSNGIAALQAASAPDTAGQSPPVFVALGVPADGTRHKVGAELLEPVADGRGIFDRDGRAV